jgi:membrane protein DedA with SNARE-associated domain
VRRTQGVFKKYGASSLVVAKFVQGLSTIAPPLAGVVRMPMGSFLMFTALAGACWAGAYLFLGWIFSPQLEIVAAYMGRPGVLGVRGFGGRRGRLRGLEVDRAAAVPPEDPDPVRTW